MARTAEETASILENLYNEQFGGECIEPFRLTWEQLRGIAGIDRITNEYLAELGETLLDEDYALLTFNNTFVVAKEEDFNGKRVLPARLAERDLAVDGGGNEGDIEIND